MKFDNISCDGCGRKFQQGEDIVVCPVCGTPQHRSCYELNGKCVNEEKHNNGFEWKGEKTEKEENPVKNDFAKESGEKRAPYLTEDGLEMLDFNSVVEARVQAVAPGISEQQRKEKLCGHYISDTIAFIGNNAGSYVKKFRKKEHFNKGSFNFAAFLFCPIWFFWRKLYKAGIIYLAITLCLTMLTSTHFDTYMTLLESIDLTAAESITDAQYAELMNATMPIMFYALITFIIRLIAGITGDKLYYKYCTKTLFEVDKLKSTADNDTLLGFYLKKSSTAVIVTLLALGAYYFLPSFLMSLFTSI